MAESPPALVQIDLHGLHVEEALTRLEDYLIKLGGLAHPAGILLRVSLVLGSCAVTHVP